MNPTQIVIGYDFSDHADVALQQGMDIARRLHAHVTLVHAFVTGVGSVSDADGVAAMAGPWKHWCRREMRARRTALVRVASRLAPALEVTPVVLADEPARAITDVAREVDADLTVVGTHGRAGIRRVVLGSVAEKVARRSPATLVARAAGGTRGGYRRILVPTDFSATADRALELATELVHPAGQIDLLHCWRPPPWLMDKAKSKLRDTMAEHFVAQSLPRLTRHNEGSFRIEFSHIEANPGDGIQQRLRDGIYQLTVIGGYGSNRVTRWFIGGVAEATIRYSPCSVLVVRAD